MLAVVVSLLMVAAIVSLSIGFCYYFSDWLLLLFVVIWSLFLFVVDQSLLAFVVDWLLLVFVADWWLFLSSGDRLMSLFIAAWLPWSFLH